MPKKKLTENKIKERRKLRERERRKKLREDPQKNEEHKLKEKQRYIKNKEKGVVKLVKDMSHRELRNKRKNWKRNTAAYRKKKQGLQEIFQDSPPESDLDTVSHHSREESLQIDHEVPQNIELGSSTRCSEKILLLTTPKRSQKQCYPSLYSLSSTKKIFATSTSTDTSSSSVVDNSVSRQKRQGRKAIRRDRCKIYRELIKLRKQNVDLKRKVERYRKREYREKQKSLPAIKSNHSKDLTPNSKVEHVLRYCPSVPIEVRKNLLFGAALQHQLKHSVKHMKSHKEKQIFAKVVHGKILKKYRLLTKAKDFLSSKMYKANETRKNIMVYERNKNSRKHFVEQVVMNFYLGNDNSTLCPGKKDCLTRKGEKKQKRYLTTTLIELHKRFIEKNTFSISYALFCRYRPFWVVQPKSEVRDTCLCIQHENMALLVSALKRENVISESSVDELITSLCCRPANESCYLRTCDKCAKNIILYNESVDLDKLTSYVKWVTTKETRISAKTKQEISVQITKKETFKVAVKDLSALLDKILPKFLVHTMNISHQFSSFTKLKKYVSENEIILHIDFSENYSCKYGKEVQAVHFGASRQQITLHTGVMYTAGRHESFCTMSDSLRHDPSAVMAHLLPILKRYLDNRKLITTLHILSDSPVTQYRNKKIFYLLQHFLPNKFPFLNNVMWNYSESGHGKGAPDGIGATLKRTCDRYISLGTDIENFEKFVEVIEQNTEKIYVETVGKKDIEKIDQHLPDLRAIKSFKGTMQLHQVKWEKTSEKLKMNSLSCFDCTDNCQKYCIGMYKSTVFIPATTRERCKQEKNEDGNVSRERGHGEDKGNQLPYRKDDWVAVIFDDIWYPGIIEDINETSANINFLARSGSDLFKGLDTIKGDRHSIELEGILCMIKPPIPASSTKFKVPEKSKIDKLCSEVLRRP